MSDSNRKSPDRLDSTFSDDIETICAQIGFDPKLYVEFPRKHGCLSLAPELGFAPDPAPSPASAPVSAPVSGSAAQPTAHVSAPALPTPPSPAPPAAESGAEPVVVLNKSDLCDDLGSRLIEIDRLTRASVVVMSALVPGAVEQLHRYVEPGRTAALVGMSGTGKSTIANLLLGGLRQATCEVRANDGRGRHTTTSRELFLLPQGWLLVDTPGMRELEVWSEGAAVDAAFDDVAQAALSCRFRDCTHQGEPDCAVILAVKTGRLDSERVANYLKLGRETSAQQIKRCNKLLGKAQNQMYRSGLRNKW